LEGASVTLAKLFSRCKPKRDDIDAFHSSDFVLIHTSIFSDVQIY
jgi:hypothetical protein